MFERQAFYQLYHGCADSVQEGFAVRETAIIIIICDASGPKVRPGEPNESNQISRGRPVNKRRLVTISLCSRQAELPLGRSVRY